MHADIDTVKVVVKNVPDYAAGKEKNDLGFLTFDLQVKFLMLFFHDRASLYQFLNFRAPQNLWIRKLFNPILYILAIYTVSD